LSADHQDQVANRATRIFVKEAKSVPLRWNTALKACDEIKLFMIRIGGPGYGEVFASILETAIGNGSSS
jgi:hypothetical protein